MGMPTSSICALPLSELTPTNARSGSQATIASILRSSNEPALVTSLNCGYIFNSWGNCSIEGCATILSAPPKIATSCVVPPLQVMAMRSTLSGMTNSLPFASMTVTVSAAGSAAPPPDSPPLPDEHPPKADAPTTVIPSAAAISRNLLRETT